MGPRLAPLATIVLFVAACRGPGAGEELPLPDLAVESDSYAGSPWRGVLPNGADAFELQSSRALEFDFELEYVERLDLAGLPPLGARARVIQALQGSEPIQPSAQLADALRL